MSDALVVVKVPAVEAEVARKQIAAIVQAHVKSFSARLSIREQMQDVAFDCYVQGLIDGYQCGGGKL